MLNDEQKATVREWAAAGAELAEIHQRIRDDLGVSMTYFDARLLVSDLEVSLDKPEEAEDSDTEEPQDMANSEPEAGGGQLVDERAAPMRDPDEGGGGGSVSVSVDSIMQPQSMVSGKVSFSDGHSAAWSIDQMGRLGFDPDQPGYQPDQEDLAIFQKELQRVLKKQGF